MAKPRRSAAVTALLVAPAGVFFVLLLLAPLATAAAEGQCLGIAFRPLREATNPSPAALRLAIESSDRAVRVLKSRGGTPPARPIPLAVAH